MLHVSRLSILALLFSCTPQSANPPSIDDTTSCCVSGGKTGTDSGTNVDDGGSNALLVTGLGSPRAIAALGSELFVAVSTGTGDAGNLGAVLRIPKTGGTPQIFIGDVDSPYALAVSPISACITTLPANGNGVVFCAPIAGGAGAVLSPGEPGLTAITIDNEIAYWTSSFGGVVIEKDPTIGGAVTNLSTSTGAFSPSGIAVASGFVYVTASGSGANLLKAPTTVGVAEELATPAQANYVDAIVDGARIIVGETDSTHPAILAFPTAGGDPTSLTGSITQPGHLARDSSHIYWTSPLDGFVYGMSLTAGALPVVVGSGINAPLAIAVDDAVYVTTADGVARFARLP